MLNYLKSEVYRILHNKSSYIFILVCSFLLVISNVVLFLLKMNEATFPYASTSFSLGNLCSSYAYVFLICIMVSGFIFANEHNNHTFKNSVSYGISRGIIYFGKLIVQMVYAMIAFVLIIGAHVASAYLLLEHTDPEIMDLLLHSCFAVLPLFLFVIAVANCFYFIVESTGGAVGASVGIILALPITCGFLGMKFDIIKKISDVLPWNLLGAIQLNFDDFSVHLFWAKNGYMNYWIAGLAQILIFVILGYGFFAKKEIK